MARVRGHRPGGVAYPTVDGGTAAREPPEPAPVERILALQGTVGNRAVAAMLSRWPALVVTDQASDRWMAEYVGSTRAIPAGTQVEVLEPLRWDGERVRAAPEPTSSGSRSAP